MTTPGRMFGNLWKVVRPHEGAVLTVPWHGRSASEFDSIVSYLRNCITPEVPPEIHNYLSGGAVPFATEVKIPEQRAFVVMCAIDEVAMDIHPSSKTRISGRSITLHVMLSQMLQERTLTGSYARLDDQSLVLPKGQLTDRRRFDESIENSGANLADQFCYLSYLPPLDSQRTVEVLVFPPSVFAGAADKVKVGFAPIAEDANDLEFTSSVRTSRPFLDARPRDAEILSKRLIAAVEALIKSKANVAILPELISSSVANGLLSRSLRDSAPDGENDDVLIIAGSACTEEMCPASNRPYNECIVYSGTGDELFRQRKLHPFNMRFDRMDECHVSKAPGYERQNHLEDIGVGGKLTICDLEGIGRVVVLICEDFEQQHPTMEVCEATRPDWIFNPVLDVSQRYGRWTHQRAVEIGRRTWSRVVVSCSATLTVRQHERSLLSELGDTEVNIGIAYDGYQQNHLRTVAVKGPFDPVTVVIPWEPDAWPLHNVGIRGSR